MKLTKTMKEIRDHRINEGPILPPIPQQSFSFPLQHTCGCSIEYTVDKRHLKCFTVTETHGSCTTGRQENDLSLFLMSAKSYPCPFHGSATGEPANPQLNNGKLIYMPGSRVWYRRLPKPPIMTPKKNYYALVLSTAWHAGNDNYIISLHSTLKRADNAHYDLTSPMECNNLLYESITIARITNNVIQCIYDWCSQCNKLLPESKLDEEWNECEECIESDEEAEYDDGRTMVQGGSGTFYEFE